MRQRQTPVLTAVRNDVRDNDFAELVANIGPLPRTDQVRGMAVTPSQAILRSESVRAAVQDPSYFFHKTAAIADATASLYVPPAAPDAALLDFKLRSAVRKLRPKDLDLQVVSALGVTTLPFLSNADVATIVAIHRDEEAFANWRAELRTIARTIGSLPSEGAEFLEEADSALSDALLPRAHELQRAVSRSATMKGALGPSALAFAVQAASLVGADQMIGVPIDVATLTALGLGTAASWLLSGVFRGARGRPHGVLATLVADWQTST